MIVKYDSHNSGGSWWLKDEDWQALEDAGWTVHWQTGDGWGGTPKSAYADPLSPREKTGGRFLGALAMSAAIEAESVRAARGSWEVATGLNPYAEGCSCCGEPHAFYEVKVEEAA